MKEIYKLLAICIGLIIAFPLFFIKILKDLAFAMLVGFVVAIIICAILFIIYIFKPEDKCY